MGERCFNISKFPHGANCTMFLLYVGRTHYLESDSNGDENYKPHALQQSVSLRSRDEEKRTRFAALYSLYTKKAIIEDQAVLSFRGTVPSSLSPLNLVDIQMTILSFSSGLSVIMLLDQR